MNEASFQHGQHKITYLFVNFLKKIAVFYNFLYFVRALTHFAASLFLLFTLLEIELSCRTVLKKMNRNYTAIRECRKSKKKYVFLAKIASRNDVQTPLYIDFVLFFVFFAVSKRIFHSCCRLCLLLPLLLLQPDSGLTKWSNYYYTVHLIELNVLFTLSKNKMLKQKKNSKKCLMTWKPLLYG